MKTYSAPVSLKLRFHQVENKNTKIIILESFKIKIISVMIHEQTLYFAFPPSLMTSSMTLPSGLINRTRGM